MSDEQRNEEEVEGHAYPKAGLNEEPADEVEGHAYPKAGLNDEPDDEVEGHIQRAG